MSAGYLRELTLYALHDKKTLIKTRKVVHCSVKPGREADTSEKFIPREHVFFPESTFLVYWAGVMVVTLMYQTLTVPFFFSFDEIETDVTVAMDAFCSFAFFCDVFVGMNSCYFRKGELIFARKAIALKYLKKWIWLDVITAPPYYTMVDAWKEPSYEKMDVSRLLRCIRLARVLKLNKSLTTIRCHLPTAKSHFIFTTLLLSLVVIHIAHWITCGFYYIALWSPVHESWLFKKNGTNGSNLEKYVMALDWAISTLTTTGHGNIAPCSTPEKMYGIAIMLISVAVFSYFVGKISANVLAVDRDETRHKAMRVEIHRYFRGRSIPKGVLHRALRHFEYGWASREETRRLDNRILDHFSEPLKNEISEHIYGRVLGHVPMFRHFEGMIIRKIARSMEDQVYAPDDIVMNEGDSSTNIYFLEKGNVDVYHKQTEHTFKILRPGEHFGELAFFTGCHRTASVRCIEFCDLLKLSRDALLDILPLSRTTLQAYELIQGYFESHNYGELGITCFLCRNSQHIARDCNMGKVTVNHNYLRNRWLRKRTSTVVLDAEDVKGSFKRRQRKVLQSRRYSLLNVKADGGWDRLKGAGWSLSKHISQSSYDQGMTTECIMTEGVTVENAAVGAEVKKEVAHSRNGSEQPSSLRSESLSSEDLEMEDIGTLPLFSSHLKGLHPRKVLRA